jgi:hypothetical protein
LKIAFIVLLLAVRDPSMDADRRGRHPSCGSANGMNPLTV